MNDSVPLVSILIPCRNAARWLTACLDSALGQSWPNCEVIVADDGSTDGSTQIQQAYAAKGVHVLPATQPGNAAAARNRALRAAQGDFIQYLDADDLLHPDKIRYQVELLARDRPGLVALSSISYFRDGAEPGLAEVQEGWPMRNAEQPAEWLLDLHGSNGPRGMIQTGQWLVPRSIANLAGPWDEALTLDDDGEYFARVVLAASGLRFARQSITFFRQHPPGAQNLSASARRSTVHFESALASLQRRGERMLEAADQAPAAKRTLARCFASLAVEAYPLHRDVYAAARAEVQRLGGPFEIPPLGKRADQLRKFFGWKLARRLSVRKHAK